MKSPDFLTYYSRVFNCVEVDTTFYGIPRVEVIQKWVADTPEDFRFCPKTPRSISHEMGLIGATGVMREFVERIRLLGVKLGPILIQLPPSFTAERWEVLFNFLATLPGEVRYAVELRSQTWYTAGDDGMALKVRQFFGEYGIAWTAIDYPGVPQVIHETADILYIRWIGEHGRFQKHDLERIDRAERLKEWERQVGAMQDRVTSAYGFFNNDYAGFAAGTALKFRQIIGLPHEEKPKPIQGTLF